MDTNPLVKAQIDAAARFLREFQNYLPVQVACWVKEPDSSEWTLFVASDQITDNFDVAYGEVVRIAAALRNPFFDPIWVKLIGIDEPLAQAVVRMPQRFAGWAPRLPGVSFDGIPVEEVYLYPIPIPVPA